jgi:Na+/melibiose symporter-like transporter
MTLQVNTRTTVRSSSHQKPTDNPRPRALLVVIGAFTCLFCTVGFLNSSGIFLDYYARDLLSHETPSTIAWIGAVAIFFLFAMSPAAGAMLDACGPTVSSSEMDGFDVC